jgi:cell division protein FtsI (penicillin-binding protein 3)|tara:strand:- start:5924 stop:7732 length:1809 start_codon:yes stop_codon:yes gene_type:complete
MDRDGLPLALSQERFIISVAPHELRDPAKAAVLLTSSLGVSSSKAGGLTSNGRPWNVIPGRYPPTVREALGEVRGIYLAREFQRYHPHGDLARGVLGAVLDNEGTGGIEQAFEEILRGIPGREVVARNNMGQTIPGERYVFEPPKSGRDIVLTLDMDLQEIARQALEESILETEARGGDVLVTIPNTGEILALVSIRDGKTASLSAINTPYEPGSTFKPFTVSGLIENDLASLEDTVDVENGTWTVAGRTLHDVHSEGRMSIADALRVSSNVGIAKAASRMSPRIQYETLRDFGFGTQTGIQIPGEVGGMLRKPERWSSQSPASLAIGYEVSVTPLQMAMAYGALANGGRLMQPLLVKEIRESDGSLKEQFEPRMVRQVIPEQIARRIGEVLVDVVEDGTGTSAQLGTFQVAGKSGTTRLYSPEGGYESGAYWSSFVGFFPAEDPQLVVFVKLERPQGAYYGGAVAAPVTRATMQAALAASGKHIDRTRLVQSGKVAASLATSSPSVAFVNQELDFPTERLDEPEMPVGMGLASGGTASEGISVPRLAGVPSRIAVRRLHALGLRVSGPLGGEILGTEPGPGMQMVRGDTVALIVRPRINRD